MERALPVDFCMNWQQLPIRNIIYQAGNYIIIIHHTSNNLLFCLIGKRQRFSLLNYNSIIMKILLDVQKVKSSLKVKGSVRLKFKIGEYFSARTELADASNGTYTFCQKHSVKIQNYSDRSYVEVTILAANGQVISQITVFLNKFKEFNKIELKGQKEIYYLFYSLTEIADTDICEPVRPMLVRTSSIEEEPVRLKQQSGKLEILRLGVLMFNFAQRLDPLIYLYNKIVNLVTWKDAYITIGMGILLTLVIYYLKMSIFLAGVILYSCKQPLFRKIQRIHRFKNNHKRLMVPQQNAYFLQHAMDNYCQIYQTFTQFLFNDDKTLLINIIQLICKMGLLLVIMLFLFGVQHLIVITLWTVLILTSPYRQFIMKYIKPVVGYVAGEYGKIIDKITHGISQVLGSNIKINQDQFQRQFYFYHYERWWVVKGWLDQIKKYSDQDYESMLVPKQTAPQGWVWIQQWKIDYEGQVDSQGYQYSHDLMTEFKANSALATRRRRKWKRCCTKLKQAI